MYGAHSHLIHLQASIQILLFPETFSDKQYNSRQNLSLALIFATILILFPWLAVMYLANLYFTGRMSDIMVERKPTSCDTFVVLPPATSHGGIIFGKNSDRPQGEVQELVYFGEQEHPAGSKVKVKFDLKL